MSDTDDQRCGGTGMVAYWDGSAYAGEMCRGCIDCEGPDDATPEPPQSADAVDPQDGVTPA
jgi:prepilin-type processing-associated H-X9-DG protein